jgi:hypothetical protein
MVVVDGESPRGETARSELFTAADNDEAGNCPVVRKAQSRVPRLPASSSRTAGANQSRRAVCGGGRLSHAHTPHPLQALSLQDPAEFPDGHEPRL